MCRNFRPKCITEGCENRASFGSRTGECNDCKMRVCKLCGARFKPTAASKPELCSYCNQKMRKKPTQHERRQETG